MKKISFVFIIALLLSMFCVVSISAETETDVYESEIEEEEYVVHDVNIGNNHRFTYNNGYLLINVYINGSITKDGGGNITSYNLPVNCYMLDGELPGNTSCYVAVNSRINYGSYVKVDYTVYAVGNNETKSQSSSFTVR